MEPITCTLTFNTDNSQVSIDGIDSNTFLINYSGDIDFTPLVILLSKKIEEEKKIELTCSADEESQTEKEKILLDTLKKIVYSYNSSFSAVTDIDSLTISGENLTVADDLSF